MITSHGRTEPLISGKMTSDESLSLNGFEGLCVTGRQKDSAFEVSFPFHPNKRVNSTAAKR